MNETVENSKTWREIYELAIGDAQEAYSNQDEPPTKEEFVETFTEFYMEYTETNIVSMWPVDPVGSDRMAKTRARIVWADEYSG